MRRAGPFARRYLFAAGATPYLFTLGLTSPRHRALIHTIASHFGFSEDVVLPPVTPDELLAGAQVVQARDLVADEFSVSFLELLVLSTIVSRARPLRLFEIGTFQGRTTINLALNAPDTAQVYTLDLPPDSAATALPVEELEVPYIQKAIRADRPDMGSRIVQLHGDSATFDFSQFYGQIDFVFIDGSHSRSYVHNDSEVALKLVRDRPGTIVWHDYGTSWPGVTDALNSLYRTRPEFQGLQRVEGTTLALLKA
jgi:predicted O-methyltransferase YrrM